MGSYALNYYFLRDLIPSRQLDLIILICSKPLLIVLFIELLSVLMVLAFR